MQARKKSIYTAFCFISFMTLFSRSLSVFKGLRAYSWIHKSCRQQSHDKRLNG